MNQWWQLWPKYFDDSACDKIIDMAKNIEPQSGSVGHGGSDIAVRENVRRSKVRWMPRFELEFLPLATTLEKLFYDANTAAFGFDINTFREIQFTEYNSNNDGHYTWHTDMVWATNTFTNRKLTMVVQLTDPASYEGGEFELDIKECYEVPNAEAAKSRGTVVVFPSFLRHRVLPVTSGIRYSMVSWCGGPVFR